MNKSVTPLILFLCGCGASYPAPSDHLASALSASRGAQEAGAPQVPQAALFLKLSEEETAEARKMMADGNNKRADFMTLRAYNDAEVSLALAREDTAKRRADQASMVATQKEAGTADPRSPRQ